MQRATERVLAFTSLALMIGGVGVASRRVHAEAFTPSAPLHVTVGAAQGAWSGERGDAARTGRARTLPQAPSRLWTWSRPGARLEWSPVVLDGAGDVVAVYTSTVGGAATTMVRLHGSDHGEASELWSAKLGTDIPATAPIVLADGAIAIALRHSQIVIVEPSGGLRARATVSTGDSSVVAIGALATGGLVVSLEGSLHALNARGDAVQSLAANVTTAIASRRDGTIVAVDTTGALVAWTPGTRPTTIGALLLTSAATGSVAVDACVGGLAIDEPLAGSTAHARALCSARGKAQVVALDLVDGSRQVVVSRTLLSSRAGIAVGEHGETVVVTSTGGVATIDRGGAETFAYDPLTALGVTNPDAGAIYGLGGEGSPLIDSASTIAFTNTDGVFIAAPSRTPRLVTRCSGGVSATGQSVASAGEGRVVVACGEGRIDLFGDTPATP
ncbi:MAG: hypothetical protein ACHREM_16180 [Polyangiales bacterium]